eukprot:tig00000630_g2731.t1
MAPTYTGTSTRASAESVLDSISRIVVFTEVPLLGDVARAPFTSLYSLIRNIYTLNVRAWHWHTENALYTRAAVKESPAISEEATVFQFGPEVHELLEGTCPATVPASSAVLWRDLLNLQASGPRARYISFAARAGRAAMKEAKAKVCLPMPLEQMVVGEAPRTPDNLASSLPAASLSMNVTLALGISRADFTAEKQVKFLQAIARQFKIPPGRLRILYIEDVARRRRLLAGSVAVTVAVQSAPGSDAASVTSSIQSAVNSATLRGETFSFGDVPVSSGLAAVNIPGAAGAVSMGDDSITDVQLIPNLPGAGAILGGLNSSCAVATSCTACTATSSAQCVWCAGTCTAPAFCSSSSSAIADSLSCSFASPFRYTFNTTQSPPDAFFTNQTVKDELGAWFESVLGLQKGAVRILSLVRGSVIVNGEVTSTQSQAATDALVATLLRALRSTTVPRTIGGITFLPACPGAGCVQGSGSGSGSNAAAGGASQTTATGGGDGTNSGAIIGGVVGGVGGAALIAAVVWYIRRRSDERKRARPNARGGKGDMESNVNADQRYPTFGTSVHL